MMLNFEKINNVCMAIVLILLVALFYVKNRKQTSDRFLLKLMDGQALYIMCLAESLICILLAVILHKNFAEHVLIITRSSVYSISSLVAINYFHAKEKNNATEDYKEIEKGSEVFFVLAAMMYGLDLFKNVNDIVIVNLIYIVLVIVISAIELRKMSKIKRNYISP